MRQNIGSSYAVNGYFFTAFYCGISDFQLVFIAFHSVFCSVLSGMIPVRFRSIVVCDSLEVCLRMCADGTYLRSFLADMDVTAVCALPDNNIVSNKHLAVLDVFRHAA